MRLKGKSLLIVGAFLLLALGCSLGERARVRGTAPTAAPAVASPKPGNTTPTQDPLLGVNTSGPLDPTQLGTVKRDVSYCTGDSVDLKMDIYFPKTASNALAPVVVYVHGGGWSAGDKAGGEGIVDIPELVTRGYLVASVNYRLAPQYPFPAQIEDVKCAVRFLRANAKTYHLDPDRIGAMGGGAGGHLVSLLGLADETAGFEGAGGYDEEGSDVQAVVDMFGPIDLTASDFAGPHTPLLQQVFGATSPQDPVLADASPVTYITKDAPPFLILHGDQDQLVPLSQSQEFYNKLKAAGAPVTLLVVKNAGYDFSPAGSGPMRPTRADVTQIIAEFFDQYLR